MTCDTHSFGVISIDFDEVYKVKNWTIDDNEETGRFGDEEPIEGKILRG